jgi:amino acid adenylation domain-containing protein
MSKKTNIKNIYPLSPMQEGMLFHARMEETTTAYVEQTVITMQGPLEPDELKRAYQGLIDRYDVLRTVMVYKTTKRPQQVVMKEQQAEFHYEDITGGTPGEIETRRLEFTRRDRERGFDLNKGPLIRLSLLKTGPEKWSQVWTFHHIIMDGWCLGIIFGEVVSRYQALRMGQKPPGDSETPPPYSRYIKWLQQQDKEESLKVWKEILQGYEELVGIPFTSNKSKTNGNREEGAAYKVAHHHYRYDMNRTAKLRRMARDTQVTENILYQTAWAILLQRLNNTADVVFGEVVSGRPPEIPGIQKMVGLFINTVPVRIRTGEGETVTQLVEKVQRQALQTRPHQYQPLADIQAQTELNTQLLNHIMVFENYPVNRQVRQHSENRGNGLTISVGNVDMYEQTNYDINLVIAPTQDTMEIKFNYNAGRYEPEEIETVMERLVSILNQAVENPAMPVENIEILTPEEKKRYIYQYNQTDTNLPAYKTIHQLFEEQVERTPDRIVISGPSFSVDAETENSPENSTGRETHVNDSNNASVNNLAITYRELNEKSGAAAKQLIKKGIQTGNVVALLMERSVEMQIGILGIFKAGGINLPIEASTPPERIEYMLKDSDAKLVIVRTSEKEHRFEPGRMEIEIMEFKRLESGGITDDGTASRDYSSDNPAHIIYTSGTTGIPKGVFVTHTNEVRVVKQTNYIDIRPEDRVLQFSNYAFDVSLFDIFGAILNGATLVLMEGVGRAALDRMPETLRREQITVFFLTTALFNALVDIDLESMKNIRNVLFGGERVSVPHVRKALDYLGPGRILHMYGPTESAVYATYYPVDNVKPGSVTIPIGKPLSNTVAFILDKAGRPVPPGVVAELFLGGLGISPGYMNRPELTDEKFIPSPFDLPAPILYGTGDQVRMLNDGNIEFIGRRDRQVKVRGYRVELGEIENRMRRHPDVKDAVVITGKMPEGDKYLIGYIVPRSGLTDMVNSVKQHLLRTLPPYMVPTVIMPLEQLPLNANGKVAVKRLPPPQMGTGGAEQNQSRNAPRSTVEIQLAKIWSEILSIPPAQLDIDDDFFQLGGHSLRAMNLVSRIQKEMGIKILLQQIFTEPTIRKIAAELESKNKTADDTPVMRDIVPVEEREYYPLTSAQRRLYIYQQFDRNGIGYNIPIVLQIEGNCRKDQLEPIFNQIIRRHESLRTSFQHVRGEPVQIIHPEANLKIEEYEAEAREEIGASIRKMIRPFELTDPPLMRVGIVKHSEDLKLLVVDMHHIITDGVSMGLLVKEFMAITNEIPLPELKYRYRDYSQWYTNGRRQGKEADAYVKQEIYWLKQMEGKPRVLQLPTDFERPAEQSFEGEHMAFEISPEETRQLKRQVAQNGSTLFIELQAICAIWLSKLTGQQDISMGTPMEGRNHPDLRRIIGMFVNTQVLRSKPERYKTVAQFLAEVKTQTLEAFENQDYLFEDLVNAVGETTVPGRNPLFDVLFTLQNMEADPTYIADRNKADRRNAKNNDIALKPYSFRNPVSKFDMMVTAVETGKEQIHITLEYAVKLFKPETIQRFIGYFEEVLRAVLENKEQTIEDIKISHGYKQVKSHNPEMDLDF